jgi:hypothetical protein
MRRGCRRARPWRLRACSPWQSRGGGPSLGAPGREGETASRAGRGVYLLPVTSRFGTRAPSVEQAVEAIAAQRGEVIVSSGAAAANNLGLTTQVPVRLVYLTSGRTRKMSLGKQIVELRHAPRWQLAMPHRPAGQAVRALAWLGPEKAEAALQHPEAEAPARHVQRAGGGGAPASDLACAQRREGRAWLTPSSSFRPRIVGKH